MDRHPNPIRDLEESNQRPIQIVLLSSPILIISGDIMDKSLCCVGWSGLCGAASCCCTAATRTVGLLAVAVLPQGLLAVAATRTTSLTGYDSILESRISI